MQFNLGILKYAMDLWTNQNCLIYLYVLLSPYFTFKTNFFFNYSVGLILTNKRLIPKSSIILIEVQITLFFYLLIFITCAFSSYLTPQFFRTIESHLILLRHFYLFFVKIFGCSVYLNIRSKRKLCIPSDMPNNTHVFLGWLHSAMEPIIFAPSYWIQDNSFICLKLNSFPSLTNLKNVSTTQARWSSME